MAEQPFLTVDCLSKSYGDLKAVDRVSFTVVEGEIVGFCGPNGAGKTTLFDLISGLTTPDAGAISVGRTILPANRPDLRVGYGIARTFQLNAAFASLSVSDNLLLSLHFGRKAHRQSPGSRRHQQIDELAERFALTTVLDTQALQISALQSKLLMLACAVASQPRFILLDEPVAGLTHAEIDAFGAVLSALSHNGGTTFLVIEHVMPFLMGISSRMIFLNNGRIEFDGRPAELARDSNIVTLYLGATAASLLKEAV